MCCVVCLFVVCLFVCLTGVCRCVFVTQTLICAYETGTMHVLVCTFVSCGCVVYMCMFLWETPLKRTLPRVLGKGGVIPILGDLGRYVGWEKIEMERKRQESILDRTSTSPLNFIRPVTFKN